MESFSILKKAAKTCVESALQYGTYPDSYLPVSYTRTMVSTTFYIHANWGPGVGNRRWVTLEGSHVLLIYALLCVAIKRPLLFQDPTLPILCVGALEGFQQVEDVSIAYAADNMTPCYILHHSASVCRDVFEWIAHVIACLLIQPNRFHERINTSDAYEIIGTLFDQKSFIEPGPLDETVTQQCNPFTM